MKKEREKTRDEKDRNLKHSEERVAASNKPGWSPGWTPSNVTQAAVHKGEMERANNTKKTLVERFLHIKL